jgi:ABC-type multidrug transport system fused ATPase/permease subunit
MLFGKKKYNYFNMVALYFKIVPAAVVIKILYNIVNSFMPTLNIIITAMFLNNAVTAVENRGKIGIVVFPLIVIIAMKLFNYYAGIGIGMINTRASNKIKKIVTPAVAEKRASVKFKYYEVQESVDIMNRAMGEFEWNVQAFFDHIFSIWNIAAQIIGFIVILGMQLWWSTIIFALACIPSFIISYIFGKKRYDVDKDMSKIDRKVGYISNILTSRDSLEERYMYGYTEKMNEEYREKYEFARIARKKVSKSWWTHTTVAGMLTFISGIVVTAMLIPLAIYPNETGEISLSVGMFVALVNAALVLSRQIQENISDYIYNFSYKFEYLKDLNGFLKFEEDNDAICLPNATEFELKSIEFKNVSFKYPNTDSYILKNFSVRLEAGKHYAIVGINGAGKTTLVKILTKLYDNYEGEILVNNKELNEYTLAEMKAVSIIVYQDFCRYPLDFYSNIAIGNINDMQNREKVENAVKIIGLSKAVDKLPKKYETAISKIKEDGVDMSGGEWQKIAFARLMVNPAPLKILDEPTAALDPVSESKVYGQFTEIVNQHKNNKAHITIFISHRLGSTKLADEIIVISEGKAAEIGTFDELMAKSGIYAEMFESQAEWYK